MHEGLAAERHNCHSHGNCCALHGKHGAVVRGAFLSVVITIAIAVQSLIGLQLLTGTTLAIGPSHAISGTPIAVDETSPDIEAGYSTGNPWGSNSSYRNPSPIESDWTDYPARSGSSETVRPGMAVDQPAPDEETMFRCTIAFVGQLPSGVKLSLIHI